MASLSETFVTKAYDKKGKKMADKGWDAYKKNMKKSQGKMTKPKPPVGSRKARPTGDAALTAKPIKKASAGSNAAVAKAGEAQRREMARTRLKTQIKKANNPATRESAQSKAQKKAMKKGPARIKGFTFGKDTI